MKKKRRKQKSPNNLIFFTVFIVFLLLIIVLFMAANKKDAEKDGEGTESESQTETEKDTVTTEITDFDTETLTETVTETEVVTDAETVPETEAYVSEKTVPVGIYKKNGKKCYRITEYVSEWPKDDNDPLWKLDTWTYPDRKNLISDVAYFAVFTSDEEEIDFTYWDETWLDRWNEYDLDGYKIGFEFDVLLKDGDTVTATVLGPEDTFALEEYFELYLYDCVAHAHDSWYSHITEKTNYDDTHNVMIKITLRDGCYDIEEILMTAFVYTPDEINADGEYIGTNRATLVVKREE